MSAQGFEGWAILELMGHRERPGYVKETEIAGGKMLRIDIPVARDAVGNDITVTEFYSVAAVYCMTPCSEEIARARVTPYNDPRPLRPMEYRERKIPAALPEAEAEEAEDLF